MEKKKVTAMVNDYQKFILSKVELEAAHERRAAFSSGRKEGKASMTSRPRGQKTLNIRPTLGFGNKVNETYLGTQTVNLGGGHSD